MDEGLKRNLLCAGSLLGIIGVTALVYFLVSIWFPESCFWIIPAGLITAFSVDAVLRLTFWKRAKELETEQGYSHWRGPGFFINVLFDLGVIVLFIMFLIRSH